ncbi:MAG: TIGR00282 family metallophosphoesterase [Patescibacteria group bacterium]
MYKILFFGDIVGAIGRKAVIAALPGLREKYSPDFVIANVENLAHGSGVTPKTLTDLDNAGFDAYTSGNHAWANPVGIPCFTDERWKKRLLRPANIMPKMPGQGSTVIEKAGVKIGLINLSGQLFMKEEARNPFLLLDEMLAQTKTADISIIDFHAEATSEKEAFGLYADGKVTAILGTHTHVPTADAKILPAGIAYQTDVGRSGSYQSVLGFEKNSAIKAFLEPGHMSFDLPEDGQTEVNCALLTVDLDMKKAMSLDSLRIIC